MYIQMRLLTLRANCAVTQRLHHPRRRNRRRRVAELRATGERRTIPAGAARRRQTFRSRPVEFTKPARSRAMRYMYICDFTAAPCLRRGVFCVAICAPGAFQARCNNRATHNVVISALSRSIKREVARVRQTSFELTDVHARISFNYFPKSNVKITYFPSFFLTIIGVYKLQFISD